MENLFYEMKCLFSIWLEEFRPFITQGKSFVEVLNYIYHICDAQRLGV